MPVGELGDPVLQGDRARDRLVPLARVGQEALGIDVDRGIGDQGHGHLDLLSQAGTGGVLLAGARHGRADAGDLASRQERVPVDPLERELAEVVEPRLAQQRQPEHGWEVAGQRLGLVVEVDQERFVEAGLDEAVGVPVVNGVQLLVGEVAGDVLG